MASVAIERDEGVEQDQFDAWFRDGYLRDFLAGSPIASCTCWSPIPQREGPMPIPRVERTHLLDLHLFFLDAPPEQSWERFRAARPRRRGRAASARVVFAAPWLPTWSAPTSTPTSSGRSSASGGGTRSPSAFWRAVGRAAPRPERSFFGRTGVPPVGRAGARPEAGIRPPAGETPALLRGNSNDGRNCRTRSAPPKERTSSQSSTRRRRPA